MTIDIKVFNNIEEPDRFRILLLLYGELCVFKKHTQDIWLKYGEPSAYISFREACTNTAVVSEILLQYVK